MPYFMIVLIPYINLFKFSWIYQHFLDNKMSLFEEYGAFQEITEFKEFRVRIITDASTSVKKCIGRNMKYHWAE